ncbi:hypothetical protein B0H10DRAFT_2059812, partial [Mycena sp. CBHHK59/15]
MGCGRDIEFQRAADPTGPASVADSRVRPLPLPRLRAQRWSRAPSRCGRRALAFERGRAAAGADVSPSAERRGLSCKHAHVAADLTRFGCMLPLDPVWSVVVRRGPGRPTRCLDASGLPYPRAQASSLERGQRCTPSPSRAACRPGRRVDPGLGSGTSRVRPS